MDPYQRMALNNAWANATLYKAASTLASGALTEPAPGFFGTLAHTLNHIYEVDLYYIDALEAGGLGRTVYDRSECTDLATLGAAQADADLRLARFCTNLTPDLLSTRRATERPNASDVTERVDALLLHLFQHQVHHRGQAHTQLHALGVAPPQLDDFHLDYGRVPSAEAYFS